jgi:hypothetical protein
VTDLVAGQRVIFRLLLAQAAVLALAGCAVPAAVPGAMEVVPDVDQVTGTYPAQCTARHAADGSALPDPVCTPGSVTTTDKAQVCAHGFSDERHPDSTSSNTAKNQAMQAYGTASSKARTELDHLVPTSWGGSNYTSNLWPEPSDLDEATLARRGLDGYRNSKDDLEYDGKVALCAPGSTLSLAEMQRAIATDWTTVRARFDIPEPNRD